MGLARLDHKVSNLRLSFDPAYFHTQSPTILSLTLASWPHLFALVNHPKIRMKNFFEHFIEHVAGAKENANLEE